MKKSVMLREMEELINKARGASSQGWCIAIDLLKLLEAKGMKPPEYLIPHPTVDRRYLDEPGKDWEPE